MLSVFLLMTSVLRVAKDLYAGSSLVNLYAKCGALDRAKAIFSHLLHRDVICWNGLISGYARHGHREEALSCFHQMQHESLCPNVVTFVCMLKACGSIGMSPYKGESIHARVAVYDWPKKNVIIGNALLGMYAKWGALTKAENAFSDIPNRDVVSWTTLIGGYTQHGHNEKAIKCLSLMQLEHISPNVVTFVCSLKACANTGALDKGIELHAEMARNGFLKKNTDIIVGTALVDMYAKCGSLTKAYEVFCLLPSHDVTSWNSLITGHLWHGHNKESLNLFEQMRRDNVSPDVITFVCILKACANLGELEKGEEIHAEIHRKGYLRDSNTSVGNALVDLYAKCGALTKAQRVFNELPLRDIVSWTILMSGYVDHGHYMEALSCFAHIRNCSLPVNAITIVCALKAYSSIGLLEKGKELHADIVEGRLMPVLDDIFVVTALVDLYAKFGELAKAKELLDELLVRDVPSWNALIAGYTEHEELSGVTLCFFRRMQLEGLLPTTFTFAHIFKACGSIGMITKGIELHMEFIEAELCGVLEEEEVCVARNGLVDMYVKCGILVKAQHVFDELPVKNVVSWTALISGYGQLGQVDHAIYLFSKMIGEGIEPDNITFTVLLNACSHGGLLDEGHMYFEAMGQSFGIVPTVEHCACMIDLFGRAGNFDDAITVIGKMPTSDYLPLWIALLGACTKWGNLDLGGQAFEHVVGLNGKCSPAHASMRNIYAITLMREE